jgi:hypothetical protein
MDLILIGIMVYQSVIWQPLKIVRFIEFLIEFYCCAFFSLVSWRLKSVKKYSKNNKINENGFRRKICKSWKRITCCSFIWIECKRLKKNIRNNYL